MDDVLLKQSAQDLSSIYSLRKNQFLMDDNEVTFYEYSCKQAINLTLNNNVLDHHHQCPLTPQMNSPTLHPSIRTPNSKNKH